MPIQIMKKGRILGGEDVDKPSNLGVIQVIHNIHVYVYFSDKHKWEERGISYKADDRQILSTNTHGCLTYL